ncbi:unnamed protein product [Merluccius merluccius]
MSRYRIYPATRRCTQSGRGRKPLAPEVHMQPSAGKQYSSSSHRWMYLCVPSRKHLNKTAAKEVDAGKS